MPEGALLARLGGDEFAALVSGPEPLREMLGFAHSVCERLANTLSLGQRAVKVGVSIGVASAAPGDCDAHELLRRADVAMYHVTANGKGGVKLYGGEPAGESGEGIMWRRG